MPGQRDREADREALSEARASVEQRRYLRVPVQVEVCAEGLTLGRCYAINLSTTGMCLQSAGAVSPGECLDLRFRLIPTDPRIEVEALVVWCTQETDRVPGMTFYEVGLHFCELGEGHRLRLREFVDRNARYCEIEEPVLGERLGWSG